MTLECNISFLFAFVFLDIPKVNLKTKEFYLFEQTNIIKCIVTAYPQPNITWEFKNRDYGKFQMVRP